MAPAPRHATSGDIVVGRRAMGRNFPPAGSCAMPDRSRDIVRRSARDRGRRGRGSGGGLDQAENRLGKAFLKVARAPANRCAVARLAALVCDRLTLGGPHHFAGHLRPTRAILTAKQRDTVDFEPVGQQDFCSTEKRAFADRPPREQPHVAGPGPAAGRRVASSTPVASRPRSWLFYALLL
jgi:hypothetical protein